MSFYNKAIPVILTCMLLSLVFGIVKINFYHNMNLPKEIVNRDTILITHSFSSHYPFVVENKDIYIVDEIKGYKQTQDIIEALNSAKEGSTVTLHLAGYGGVVDSVIRIINAMKSTKANVIAQVEAPVYSGHAYIALASKTLVVEPYAIIMMHHSSGYGTEARCDKYKDEVDRGQTMKDSCLNYLKSHLYLTTSIIKQLNYLTQEQKETILQGKDVYMVNDGPNKVVLYAK